MHIGPYKLVNPTALAPMAGVTDRPFRQLCKKLGAGYVVSEMVSANPQLRQTRKTQLRMNHSGEVAPIAVQIAGADPDWLAAAARFNVQHGAQIIDINMGCPAKKVCNRLAGSALLSDEKLVARILAAVVAAVEVPVTLKIRTGPSREQRNAVTIARIAEDAGIQALAVHGRTRADKYQGHAEYDTIARVKQSISLPLFVNGDIDSPEKAQSVMTYTAANGVMIGRAAQGNPWIFQEITYYLQTGQRLKPPSSAEIITVLQQHVRDLHDFYGEYAGLRIARKHIGWYLKSRFAAKPLLSELMRAEDAQQQLKLISRIEATSLALAA